MSEIALAMGQRVLVTGLPGSGKSTFSRSLAARTGLPLIYLDLQFWKPGWVAPTEDEWREKQRRVLAGDAWIADGNYSETLELRLERADTVVVLDTAWPVCAGRALVRGVRMSTGEMPEGCEDSAWRRLRDEWPLAVRIWRKRRSEPAREREIISQHGQHATVHVLGSKRAASDFLARLVIARKPADDASPPADKPDRGPNAPRRRATGRATKDARVAPRGRGPRRRSGGDRPVD
jgi:adenylate kinase family enzyme